MNTKKILIITVILILVIIGLITSPLFRKQPRTDIQKLSYINPSMTPIEVYNILGEELNKDCINETTQECYYLPKKTDSISCDSLSDNDERLKCKVEFELDSKYCYEIQNHDLQYTCLFYLNNEIEKCKKVKNIDTKNFCFAIYYNSADYCKKMAESDMKNLCFYRLTGDINYCQKIMDICGSDQKCKSFENCFIKKVRDFTYSYESHHFCRYFMDPYLIGLCMQTSREILK